jgi:hypothetical protein
LVQRGGRVAGVWVAVVKVAVCLSRVTHSRHAVQWVHRQQPRCSFGVEKSSWSPPRCRLQGLVASTWRKTQVRSASLSHHPESKKNNSARYAEVGSHSPLTCGGEHESDAE